MTQPFSRLVAKDPDTNRIVQDIYDKLAAVISQLNAHTTTTTTLVSSLSNQVSDLRSKVVKVQ